MTAAVAKLPQTPSKKPAPDFSKGIDVFGVWSPVMFAMSSSHSVVVGGTISGGMRVSGNVRRIVRMPDGLTWVIVQLGQDSVQHLRSPYGAIFLSEGGLLSELNMDMHEQLTEENCGPFPPNPIESSRGY